MRAIRVFAKEFAAPEGGRQYRFMILLDPGDGSPYVLDEIHDANNERLESDILYQSKFSPDAKTGDYPEYFQVNLNTRAVEVIDKKVVERYKDL